MSKYDCTVKNWGCAGINSNQLLANLGTLIEDEDDIVVVTIGTNDRHNTTKAVFLQNLQGIVNYCISHDKQIILCSATPTNIANETETVTRYYHMEDVDSMIMAIAQKNGIDYVSFYKHFLDYCLYTNTTIESLLADGLHPNDDGYAVIFRTFCDSIGIGTKRPGATW